MMAVAWRMATAERCLPHLNGLCCIEQPKQSQKKKLKAKLKQKEEDEQRRAAEEVRQQGGQCCPDVGGRCLVARVIDGARDGVVHVSARPLRHDGLFCAASCLC